jgi:hypothetical protein
MKTAEFAFRSPTWCHFWLAVADLLAKVLNGIVLYSASLHAALPTLAKISSDQSVYG